MSVAVEERRAAHGGVPARRAVTRWAWRLFRREWRQQSLVLALLLVAVAATTIGLGLAVNTPSTGTQLGTADHRVTLLSTGAQLDADVALLRSSFGAAEVIAHQNIPLPGSSNGLDLRDQTPHGPYGRAILRLDAGRWPQGPTEIAVTDRVAKTFKLHIGGTWNQLGRQWTVVGRVENPLDLEEPFALVAPGQIPAADHVDVLLRAGDAEFRAKPRPQGMGSTLTASGDTAAGAALVMALATIGLVFVGLLAVAGFTVMAQRRLRALGMLGAIGASHRHIRLVLVSNGLILGAVGALAGAAVGVAGWVALSPLLEPLVGHRMDRFNLPWLTILGAVALATVTAVGAAWWPARAAARMPIVAALSARPAPPRPAHRFAAAGTVLLAVGLTALYLSQQKKVPYIIGGVLGTAVALLLLAPVGVAAIGRLALHAPLAARLAMRDLARYRARSGAALAAIALALGIASTVALGAGVSAAKLAAPTGGNLPADQIVVWLTREATNGPVPMLTATQVDAMRAQVDVIARQLAAASTLPLTGAVDLDAPMENGGRPLALLGKPHRMDNGRTMYSSTDWVPLFVATPELLAHFGIDPGRAATDADLLTPRANVDGYDLIPGRDRNWQPTLQPVALPGYSSLPNILITTHAMAPLHLTPVPVGWLIKAPHPLAAAELDRVREIAAAAGLSVESRPTAADQARLGDYFTAAGILVALGVLAMTVGLIRSETARDLRTLTATGARRNTRRALTAATAGSLAVTGAVIGCGCAYLAMLTWYHREVHWMARPPVLDLVAVVVGLPVVAYLGGWLLAGREAPTIARQPLD